VLNFLVADLGDFTHELWINKEPSTVNFILVRNFCSVFEWVSHHQKFAEYGYVTYSLLISYILVYFSFLSFSFN